MITIHGLTARQKQLMDLLWNCQDLEQITDLVNALPTVVDRYDALSLVMIATWESLEQELGFSKEDCDAAAAAISHAMR